MSRAEDDWRAMRMSEVDDAMAWFDAIERIRFENWVTAPPIERTVDRFAAGSAWPGQYRDYSVQLAWDAWQESGKRPGSK